VLSCAIVSNIYLVTKRSVTNSSTTNNKKDLSELQPVCVAWPTNL